MPNFHSVRTAVLSPKSGVKTLALHRKFALPLALALTFAATSAQPAFSDSLRTLLVGGGPTLLKNQVAIESNVRYLTRLLPENAVATTLFADGDLNSPTVLYTPAPAGQKEANIVFNQLYPRPQGRRRGGEGQTPGNASPERRNENRAAGTENAPNAVATNATGEGNRPTPTGNASAPAGSYKVPDLKKLDGSSTRQDIEKAFGGLSGLGHSTLPYFLYFTGHGNGKPENRENNYYYLWKDDLFTVQDLSKQIARLPEKEPVVLVMVQCYSGAFANVLFEGGDPKANLVERDVVGFFASTKDRLAAGCSPSINEEYYYDFTSYFFSALTGRDRLNRPFQGSADYNKDGKIGLDEAFHWSLINDKSIDVPVATSDVFLERFAPLQGDSWQDTSYQSLLKWASPAQRVVLEELSSTLELTGEQRIRDAQKLDIEMLGSEGRAKLSEIDKQIQAIRDAKLPALQIQFPGLLQRTAPEYADVRRQALAQIEKEVTDGKWKELIELDKARDEARKQTTESSVYTAKRLRFLRVAQKVVQDHELRNSNNEPIKQRYFKLLESEGKSLLPYRKDLLAQIDREVWKP